MADDSLLSRGHVSSPQPEFAFMWLTLQAWTELALVDIFLFFGFRTLRNAVAMTRVRTRAAHEELTQSVLAALQTADILYFKKPLCLHHAAALTRLLRRRGIAAELVIGCHMAPLRGHAWVEVCGAAIGEQMDGLEFFCVLDRW